MKNFIKIKENMIVIPDKNFREIEREYGLESLFWFNETAFSACESSKKILGRPSIGCHEALKHEADYFITEVGRYSAPHVTMRQGNNEGYIVEFEVYDQKTWNKKGSLSAKTFEKENALRLAKDLWNITEK